MINPGSDQQYAHGDFYSCSQLESDYNCDPTQHQLVYGAAPTVPARRLYRGIEVLARKTLGSRLWVQASYVFSSLRGNYDGGINEAFLNLHAGGNERLQLSRLLAQRLRAPEPRPPPSLPAGRLLGDAAGLSVGLQAWAESGAPLDKLGYLCCGISAIQLVPRGYAGRLPTTYDANLTLAYPISRRPGDRHAAWPTRTT